MQAKLLLRRVVITAFTVLTIVSIFSAFYKYVILESFNYETKDISEFTEDDL